MDKIVTAINYRQLTSLTLNDIRFSINQLEMLLPSYPSLIYLNFMSNENSSFENLRRFSNWENFLHEKLPRLKNFHFQISAPVSRCEHFSNIKSIIGAFRTPFWIKDKCWYAKFQYVVNNEGPEISNSIIHQWIYRPFSTVRENFYIILYFYYKK